VGRNGRNSCRGATHSGNRIDQQGDGSDFLTGLAEGGCEGDALAGDGRYTKLQ
jgi:hypothetical protein